MKNGLYEYKDDSIPGSGHVVIDVTETEKMYTFKLVENTCRYDPWRISSLFKKSTQVRIKKYRSKHSVMTWDNGFVIYPYRDGIPYLFKYIERGKRNEEIKIDNRTSVLYNECRHLFQKNEFSLTSSLYE